MLHCDEVLADRLGGPDGYALLLASVKKYLPYSFINGASSYAPYCTKLLHHHYSAGPFYRHLKQTLSSTSFKSSIKNFACDTKRELDHLDAVKSFRPGSSVESATVRMSLMDFLNEIRAERHDLKISTDQATDNLGWQLAEVDESHIRGGSISNENALITPSINALGFYTLCATKDLGLISSIKFVRYILNCAYVVF